KMTDFGIARIDDGRTSITKTGAMMGTVSYMAPEQRLSARRASVQSDIYSLGASLFVLMEKGSTVEIFMEEKQAVLFADLKPEMQEFLKKACHASPKNRFQNTDEMIEALESLKALYDEPMESSMPLFVKRDLEIKMDSQQVTEITALISSMEDPSKDEEPSSKGDSDTNEDSDHELVETNDVIEHTDDSFNDPSIYPASHLESKSEFFKRKKIVFDPSSVQTVAKEESNKTILFPEPEEEDELEHAEQIPQKKHSQKQPNSRKSVDPPPTQEEKSLGQSPVVLLVGFILIAAAVFFGLSDRGAKGTLILDSRPSSQIEISGQVFFTPVELPVSAGVHEIRLTTDSNDSHQTSLTIQDGMKQTYCWDFESKTRCNTK
ncbi:MAG: protein kinase, partial [Myxococcota bacterium]|nr:protein kinase [Myxococcota bacterium]